MEQKILDNEDYKKILKSKYNQGIEFLKAKWMPLSENIEGFMGDHYILELNFCLNGKEKSDSFFVKTKPQKTAIQTQVTTEFNSYQKETFLYDFLQKEFHKSGYDVSFAPWCYYCKNSETMVSENLKATNFQLVERNSFFDLEHCKAALKSMATYHGNSISYEEKLSAEAGRPIRLIDGREEIFKEMIFVVDNSGLAFKFWDKSVKCFLKIADLLPKSEEWKENFRTKLKSFDFAKDFNRPLPYRKTCGHGDLWSNNMLFQYSNNIPVHCKLVDFQLVRYHHPCFDALLILYENTRRDFRKKYLEQLLNFYYSSLEQVVSNNGFDLSKILSKQDFWESVKHMEKVALFQGASVKTMVLLPPKLLNSMVNDGGDELKDLMFDDERVNLVFKGIQENEEFRDILFEDAYDMYDFF